MTMAYYRDDTVFNAIDKYFVTLKSTDVKDNNIHLRRVIFKLIERMKDEDPFFKEVYNRIVYGGSYYKRTRVGSPDEFDLDIVIKLPINYNNMRIEPCCPPGFVKIHSGLKPSELQNNKNIFNKALSKLLDPAMYLNQRKFRDWIESILSKTLNKLIEVNNKYILETDAGQYMVKIRKSGPAFTLCIYLSNKVIYVDLVPVLELSHYLPNITQDLSYFQKTNWYAVPKPIDNFPLSEDTHLFWRTCFYEQEKEILAKNGKIKSVLRQMKKLRDTQYWVNMASYYIETLFLHAVEECSNLQQQSCTYLFMMMLEKFHVALQNERIPYYWNAHHNLLFRLNSKEISNIKGRLNNIIISIKNNIQTDSLIIARHILDGEENIILRRKLYANLSESDHSDDFSEVNTEILSNEKSAENKGWQCVIL